MTWKQDGKQVISKSASEWSTEANGVGSSEPAPCTDCGCTLAPGGVCSRCGKPNAEASSRQRESQENRMAGICCPKCRSRSLRPSYRTDPFEGELVEAFQRIKFCRDCGERVEIYVTERIINGTPPSK